MFIYNLASFFTGSFTKIISFFNMNEFYYLFTQLDIIQGKT